jgi:electron transport complex protein RnfG
MKKLESSLLNMVLVLTCVAVIMGAILAAINSVTTDPIAQQEKKALAEGIQKVMGGQQVQASDKADAVIPMVDEKGKTNYYSVYNVSNAQGNAIGAAIQDTVNGFGGNLVVLVGFDNEGIIKGYTLLKHAETPGLGAKADQWFQDGQKGDIVGLSAADSLFVSKDKDKNGNSGKVEAITASTITSRAFLQAVNRAYKAWLKSKGAVAGNADDCNNSCGEKADCGKPCCKDKAAIGPTNNKPEQGKEAQQ